MTVKVFISYRREDTKWQAREIFRTLTQRLPREHVFMDVDSIPPGTDFVSILEGWVDQCSVLLVLIGPNWVDAIDSKTSKRRLENPNDFVRIEVRKGLARGIPVVPVLIDGAQIPRAEQLPYDLQPLVRRNAEFVELRTVEADVARLVNKLGVVPAAGQVIRALTGTLVVTRRTWTKPLDATCQLLANGQQIGRIWVGSTKEFQLPVGHIVLQAQLHLGRSNLLEIDIAAGHRTGVEITQDSIWKIQPSLILTRVG